MSLRDAAATGRRTQGTMEALVAVQAGEWAVIPRRKEE